MDSLLQQIEKQKAKLDRQGPLPSALVKNLWDWYRVELTYTSNAIEGNTLSRQETALVIEKGLTVQGKTLKEHLEAVNHAEALDYIRSLVTKKHLLVTEQTILEIHRMILHKIDDSYAGRYRAVPVRVAGSAVVFPNPLKVPDLMEKFILWLKSTVKEHPVKRVIEAHLRLVSIHPFVDGNGRVARLLMNLILMQTGYPPCVIKKESRLAYINSIERAQLDQNSEDYYSMMYQAILESLDLYLDMLKSKSARKKLEPSKKLLKIGQLAKVTGETVHTLRFWTKEGLLVVKDHSPGGYQLYDPSMIERVRAIRKLQQEKRLTIAEIKSRLSDLSRMS